MSLIEEAIEQFLYADKKDQYWRAVELHEELIGPGDKQLLKVKEALEAGVASGLYERKIFTKKKVISVGYQWKRKDKMTITADDVGKASDILGDVSGWKRKE